MRIPVNPLGKPRMTQRDKWKERPATTAYHAYCDELNLRLPGYELPQSLNITFYLPMPKTWSKAKRGSLRGLYHNQKPDIDNLLKAFMDAFKSEDKHVANVIATKMWAEEGAIELLNV